LGLKKIGTRFGGSLAGLAELVAAAETRATEKLCWARCVDGIFLNITISSDVTVRFYRLSSW
jgi:hypothetical protein